MPLHLSCERNVASIVQGRKQFYPVHAAARLVGYSIAAGVGYLACLGLMGGQCQPAAADAPAVISSISVAHREGGFVLQKSIWLKLKETSVTDNHCSVRGKNQ
jgi:hypothetical protein